MTDINDFTKKIKIALIERGLTQKELAAQISEMTGLKVDEQYLSNVIAGRRVPPKIIEAVVKILFDEETKDETTDAALQEIRLS